jgi:hypothetical protein
MIADLRLTIIRETKLEDRNSKLGSRGRDFVLGFSIFDLRVSILASQSAISSDRREAPCGQ